MKAFPTHKEEGMELRDYFATQIMQALIQASSTLNMENDSSLLSGLSFESAMFCGVNDTIDMQGEQDDGTKVQYTWAKYYAEEAYWLANAMMQARKDIKE
jgi:hypothetical protein